MSPGKDRVLGVSSFHLIERQTMHETDTLDRIHSQKGDPRLLGKYDLGQVWSGSKKMDSEAVKTKEMKGSRISKVLAEGSDGRWGRGKGRGRGL